MDLDCVLNRQHICFGQRANMCFETGLIRRHNLLYNRFVALTPTVTNSLTWIHSLCVTGQRNDDYRARFLFAASLLTITAGHVLRISLSTAGSNSIHHVSPVPSLLCHLSNTLLSNTCNKKLFFCNSGMIFNPTSMKREFAHQVQQARER